MQTLLKILIHRLSDECAETKSNTAYATGLLCTHSESTAEIIKAYPTILSKLEPMLHQNRARTIDNSVGCVSRMISAHPDAVPLSEVIPALIELLPLREDFEENEAVWPMIIKLCEDPIV